MDFNKINIESISFKNGYKNNINVMYKSKKLLLKTSSMICNSSILEDGKNKYKLTFDLTDSENFSKFLIKLQLKIKSLEIDLNDEECSYINFLKTDNTWKVRVPYRYKKFEVDIQNEDELITTSDIKENMIVDCVVELTNIWVYQGLYGCIWTVKKINIR